MAEAGPELPHVEELVGEEEHRDRYGRLVAIAVVCTTLVAALVAFAQAGALRTHDLADARAEKYGALALEAAAVNRGKAEVQIDRLNTLTQQVRSADNASLFLQYSTSTTGARLAAARWNALAKQTEADTVAIARSQGVPYICSSSLQPHCPAANAAYSPEQDPRFPTRYMQQGQWTAYQLTALRDAANEEADDAEAQFVHYAATLTMLAVAVFLFGYSLTPHGRPRRVLYARLASVFVLVAGIWAGFQALSPVSHPSDAAATAFANGEVALNEGSYPAAISDFDRAIALRPRFVDAYHERGLAEFASGYPHIGSGVGALPTTAGPVTIPSVAALDKAVRDDERARGEGSDSATVLVDLGTALLYRGLLEHRTDDLRASRYALTEALTTLRSQDNATDLVAGSELRTAEADVALGEPGATAAYRAADSELGSRGVPREVAVAAALTDLSLIETERPQLASRVAALRQQLVAAGERGDPTPTGRPATGTDAVELGHVSAQPDPGHALYTIGSPGNFDPERDVLSAQWEYKDPLHGEWAVLPEISGPVGRGGLIADGRGLASNNISYVSSSDPATCLPPGQYRVELYVNGRLAGSASARATWPALHAVRFSAVDGAICVPAGWTPFGSLGPGADGYLAPDQSGGALILSIPKAATGPLAGDQPGLAYVMQSALQGFGGSGGPLPGAKAASKPQPTAFFMSSDNGQLQQWTYKHGVVLTGVGTSSNGQIYVGVAWGPPNGELANDLFLSLSPV